jgi:hypothetical protein
MSFVWVRLLGINYIINLVYYILICVILEGYEFIVNMDVYKTATYNID